MRRSWIIWYAVVLHLWWGVSALTVSVVPQDASGGVSWGVYVNNGGMKLWACLMILAAALVLAALWRNKADRWSLLAVLLQQAILTVGAIGGLLNLAGIDGDFALSRIIRVLPLAWGALIFHTLAVIDHHVGRLR